VLDVGVVEKERQKGTANAEDERAAVDGILRNIIRLDDIILGFLEAKEDLMRWFIEESEARIGAARIDKAASFLENNFQVRFVAGIVFYLQARQTH